MSISAFGVEHTDIEKAADKATKQRRWAAVAGASPIGSGWAAPIYNTTQAKKGRKLAVFGRTTGRAIAEGTPGAFAGGAVGALVGRKNPMAIKIGATAGSIGSQSHSSYAAMRNAQTRGDIKKSAFGVEHDVDKAFGAGFATGAKNLVAGAKNLGAKALKPLNSASYIPKSGTIGGKTFGTPGSTMKITSGQKKIGAGVGAGALGAGAFGIGNKRNY